MTRLAVIAILSLPLFCQFAAAVDTPLTLDELTKKSDHIVIGTVKKIRHTMGLWQGLGVMPFREVTVEVQEQWKGKLSAKELVLQVPGGKYPNGYRLEVEHQPSFRNGEKVLVFTRSFVQFEGAPSRGQGPADREAPAGKPQWVFGGEQGKYTMVVKRIVGKMGHPIGKDTLTHPLRKRIRAIEPGNKKK